MQYNSTSCLRRAAAWLGISAAGAHLVARPLTLQIQERHRGIMWAAACCVRPPPAVRAELAHLRVHVNLSQPCGAARPIRQLRRGHKSHTMKGAALARLSRKENLRKCGAACSHLKLLHALLDGASIPSC